MMYGEKSGSLDGVLGEWMDESLKYGPICGLLDMK